MSKVKKQAFTEAKERVALPPGIKQSTEDEEKQGLGRGRKEDYPEVPDPFEGE